MAAEAHAAGRELSAVEKARMTALLDALNFGLTGQVPKLIDIAPLNQAVEALETGSAEEKDLSISAVGKSEDGRA